MALDPKGAALALHRFGFGPRPGLINAVAADPRGALLAELDRPNAGQIVDSTLQSAAAGNRAVFEFNAARAARDKSARLRREAAQRENPGMAETEFTIVRTGGDKEASDRLYSGMNPMTSEDLADLFWWLANLPPHLNINTIELMPVSQTFAGFTVNREA